MANNPGWGKSEDLCGQLRPHHRPQEITCQMSDSAAQPHVRAFSVLAAPPSAASTSLTCSPATAPPQGGQRTLPMLLMLNRCAASGPGWWRLAFQDPRIWPQLPFPNFFLTLP